MSLIIPFIIPFLTALVISAVCIPAIIKLTAVMKIYDKPNSSRKIHTHSSPTLGGVAIYIGLLFSVFYFEISCESFTLPVVCAASVLLFIIALKDDLMESPPTQRLIVQLLVACFIVFLGNLSLKGDMMDISLNSEIGWLWQLISVLFIAGIINAYNMIDGIDGLAGSLSLLATLGFGFLFFIYQEIGWAQLSFILAGGILGFLIFNFSPARIFMGDVGSMVIGLFIAVFALKASSLSALTIQGMHIISVLPLFFSLIMIPLCDILTVIVIRLINRKSPFAPDKNHIHHRFLQLGFSHALTTCSLTGFSLLVLIGAYYIQMTSVALSILFVFIAAAILESTTFLLLKKGRSKA